MISYYGANHPPVNDPPLNADLKSSFVKIQPERPLRKYSYSSCLEGLLTLCTRTFGWQSAIRDRCVMARPIIPIGNDPMAVAIVAESGITKKESP